MLTHPDDPVHVVSCVDCQARFSLEALDVDLEHVWTGITARVWAPPVGLAERLSGRLLGSPGLARALVTTPSLVLAWIIASATVLAIGVVVTRTTGTPWVALLAPALAGIGVAYAYGPGVDPAFELSRTMAVSYRMVLLIRAVVVFAVNAAFGVIASLFTATTAGITLGWLIPMTTVSALALAAATLTRSANVGVALALSGWSVAVLGSAFGTHDLSAAVAHPSLIPEYVAATVFCLSLALHATSDRRSGRTI